MEIAWLVSSYKWKAPLVLLFNTTSTKYSLCVAVTGQNNIQIKIFYLGWFLIFFVY